MPGLDKYQQLSFLGLAEATLSFLPYLPRVGSCDVDLAVLVPVRRCVVSREVEVSRIRPRSCVIGVFAFEDNLMLH